MHGRRPRRGTAALALLLWACGCNGPPPADPVPARAPAADPYAAARQRMVATQLQARNIDDPEVLRAMAVVPRHLFVPPAQRHGAYDDRPLPIGLEQTISQPYIVAYMTASLEVHRGDRVLEIGTGSGYQAAVLAELGAEVYTIEILPELADRARAALADAGYRQVRVRAGDGWFGWPEAAPFDGILVTAAPERVPAALVDQLADGAHLVLPVGDREQELVRVTRTGEGTTTERLLPVRFVPMTGRAREGP